MKIQPGTCRCGALLYLVEDAGLRWTADMTPLDAQEATAALLAGRELYRLTLVGKTPSRLRTAKPDVLKALRTAMPDERPIVVGSHPCPTGAARALLPAPQPAGGPGGPTRPPKAPVPPSRPFSGQPTVSSSAPDAGIQGSEGPRCDDCGLIMRDGEYVSAQLGEVYVWAIHLTDCGR